MPSTVDQPAGAPQTTSATAGTSSVRSGVRVLVAVGLVNIGTWIFLLLSAQALGAADFGALSAMLGLLNIVGLPLGAVQVGVARNVAELRAAGKGEEAAALGRAFMVAAGLAAAGAAALFLALLVPLANLLDLDSLGAFALLGLAIPVTMALPIALGLLQGEERFREYSVALALTGALRPAAFGLLLVYGYRLVGAVLATVVSGVVAFGVAIRHAASSISRAPVRLSTLRGPAVAIAPIAVGMLAITALTNVDLLVAKAALDPHDAGVFGAGAFIGRAILYLPLAIVAVMFPRVATRQAKGHDTLDILGRSVLVVGACGLLFTAALFLFPEPILRIGFGEEYASGADELGLFGLSASAFSLLNVYVSYELSRGSHRFGYELLALAGVQLVLLALLHESIRTILLVDLALGVLGLVYYEVRHGGARRALGVALLRVRRSVSAPGEGEASLGTAARVLAGRGARGAGVRARALGRRMAIPSMLTGLYLAGAVVVTWPVAANMNGAFFGFGNDNLGGIWNFWWWGYAADHGLDPSRSPFLSAPFGFDLAALPVQPWERYMGQWLTQGFGEVAAYNIIVLASFPLAGLFTYLLANYLVKDKLAAAIAGGIFAFSPFHLGMAMNYPALSSVQFVPLFFLLLARGMFERKPRDIFGAVLAFGLLAAGSYYYAYYAIPIVGVLLIAYGLRYRRSVAAGARRLAGAFRTPRGLARSVPIAVASAAVLAFLISRPLQLYLENRDTYVRPLSEAVRYSARPWAWFTPGLDHPVYGDDLVGFYYRHLHDAPSHEQALYLGYIPLALAILGLWVGLRRPTLRRGAAFAGLLGISGFVIALGPFLPLSTHYYGLWPAEGGDAKLPLPGRLLFEFAPTFRFFARAQVFVVLALALAAAIGVVWLCRRFPGWPAAALVALVVVGVTFEYANRPPGRVVDVSETPQIYRWLADQPGQFIVAEYPMSPPASPRAFYYQFWERKHQKRLVNVQNDPNALAAYASVADIADPATAGVLAGLGVRYAIVHTDLPPSTYPPYQPVLPFDGLPKNLVAGYPQLKLVHRLPGAEVYRVLKRPRATGGRAGAAVAYGAGFYGAEGGAGGVFRWMDTEGAMLLRPIDPAGGPARFEAVLQSFAQPRTVTVRLDGRVVGRVEVGTQARTASVPLTLSAAAHTLTLTADPPARTPAEVLGTPDGRTLAVSVRDARVIAAR